MRKQPGNWVPQILSIAVVSLLLPAGASSQPGEGSRPRPPGFIDQFDTDGDRLVSLDEFTEAFSRLDANGDGFIDDDEAPKPPRRGRRGSHRPAGGEEGGS